jgi:phosphate:Na+ symporter
VALTAAQSAIRLELQALLGHTSALLGDTSTGKRTNLVELQVALNDTTAYIGHINLETSKGPNWERLIATIHVLDHMQRLHERCEEEENRAITARETAELSEDHKILTTNIAHIIDDINNKRWTDAAERATKTAYRICAQVEVHRDKIMANVAAGTMDAPLATACLEAIRWMERVSTHIARITHHMEQAAMEKTAEPAGSTLPAPIDLS